jgi:hypothetical protein
MNQKQKTELRPGSGVRPGKLKSIIAATLLLLATSSPAQVVLTGTNYSQNFNGIGAGLPPGWTVRTNASATSLGTTVTFTGATKTWVDTGGNFGNCASVSGYGTNFLGTESPAIQNAGTNRCPGIRQTAAFGNPGGAFVLQIADTIGISNIVLGLDLNMLSVQGYSTTWTIDYGVGNTPTSFTPLATYSDPGAFGATSLANLSLNADANDQAQNIWIRVVALSAATGSGSRDTFGIDNVSLAYSNVNASVPATPPNISSDPSNRTSAVATPAAFTVSATGTAPLYYQWYRGGVALTNGGTISGATTDTLTISQVFHTNAGNYTVVVTNAAPSANSVTSAPAVLAVVGFAIAPVVTTNTLAGTPVTVGLSFIDNQTPVTSVTGVSSNQSLLPNAGIAGAAAGSSGHVTLTPAAGADGVARVYLTISDGSFTTNTSFPVLVVPSSEVVFNDHFDYANGAITSGSLGLWQNYSGPAGEAIVTNGQLRVSRSFDEDVSARLIGAPYATNSTTVLYSRFKVNFTTLPTAIGNYFALFKDDTISRQVGRVWASTANAASGYRLGIGNANTAAAASGQFPLDLVLGETNTVVTRLVLSNGLATIWINPTSETSPSVTASDAVTNLVAVTAFAFRQDSSEGIMWVDDLVVATSFAAVWGAGPSAPVPLEIKLVGNNAVLTWSNAAFKLQAAPFVSGLYTNIPGATSPYTNPISGNQKYFRLIYP